MKTTEIGVFGGLLLALGLVGCDSLECGPGTHRRQDECVPNIQLECGPGTSLRDGRCIGLDAAAARVDVADVPDAAALVPDDAATDAPTDAPTDRLGGAPTDALTDARPGPPPPDMPAPSTCPAALLPGPPATDCGALPPGESFCVAGRALDFTTGCALPMGTALIVIDPTLALAMQDIDVYTRGQGTVGPGGAYAIVGTGSATQLALVIDDADDVRDPHPGRGDLSRSSNGVSATPAAFGTVYAIPAFATSQAQQAIWNAALGEGEGFLEQNGFLVGRVTTRTDGGLVPLSEARVSTLGAQTAHTCPADGHCLRFFTDDPTLSSLVPVGTARTTASGAFLFIRGGMSYYRSVFVVNEPADTYPSLPAGANFGSGFHAVFVPRAP